MPLTLSAATLFLVKALRLLLATVSVSLALAVVAVVALAAPEAAMHAASPSADAAQAVYCPAGELSRREAVVKRYQKQMAAARKAYFRKTKNAKQRQAFLKKQQAQLKTLQRAVAACD